MGVNRNSTNFHFGCYSTITIAMINLMNTVIIIIVIATVQVIFLVESKQP